MFFKTKTHWHKAFGSLKEAEQALKINEPFYLLLGGKAFCVVRTQDGIFAMDDKCPHQGASLSGGYCSGGNIVCPWHHYHFNLKNGRQAGGGGDYVRVHKTLINNEGVFIGIEKISFLGF
jgi:nitrite reductase/ring-hydroxylating ferredoxin subunit